jgi:hypothetical protein
MAMHWFRRHQKHFLAALVVLLMLSWGVLGTLQRLVSTRTYVGTIGERRISMDEVQRAKSWLRFQARLTGARTAPTDMDAWRWLVMEDAATEAGIVVSNDELAETVKQVVKMNLRTPEFKSEDYDRLLELFGMSAAQFEGFLRSLLRVMKYQNLVGDATFTTTRDLWLRYQYQRETASVRFVDIDPAVLLPAIKVSEEDKRAFYEKHKDALPNPDAGTPGYKDPRRVVMQVAAAETKNFADKVTITDEQITQYYEQNKDEFLLPPEPEKKLEAPSETRTKPETEPEAEPKPQPAPEPAPEPAPTEGGGGGEGEPEKTAPASEAAEPAAESAEPAARAELPKPRFKPLEDVRETIHQKLRDAAARRLAEEALDSLTEEIKDLLRSGEDIQEFPLEELAAKQALTYKRTEPLTREELSAFYPGGSQFAPFAFDTSTRLYDQRIVEDPDFIALCQYVADVPEKVLPYEEVAERVERDLRAERAVEAARRYGEQLVKTAAERGLKQAAADLSARFVEILKTEAPAAKLPAEGKPLLTVAETDLFRRPGLGGSGPFIRAMGGDRPAVAEKAFALGKGEWAVVTDGVPPHAYVIELADRRMADAREFMEQRGQERALLEYRRRGKLLQQWRELLMENAHLSVDKL